MRMLWALLAAVISTSALANDDLAGLWRTEVNDEGVYATVEIGACENNAERVCGIIMQRVDANGVASESEHSGKHIIKNMRPTTANKWAKGTIWAPDDDKTYKSKMTLTDEGLKVSGCVFGGLICRSQTWLRVE